MKCLIIDAVHSSIAEEFSKYMQVDTHMLPTQEELAKRCGVSRQTVNAIENNKYDPTLSLAFRLARELEMTVDGLFTHP